MPKGLAGDDRSVQEATVKGVYAIVGIDGVGKTSVANAVAAHLDRQGEKTVVVWLRKPRVFSFVLYALFRVFRISRCIRMRGDEDVRINLSHHPILFTLFAWVMTFDYLAAYFLLVTVRRLLGRTVVCDRFVWDLVVDLAMASGLGEAFCERPEGRILTDLGRRHRTIHMTASIDTLVKRKPILALDPRFLERVKLYECLATHFAMTTLDDDGGSPEHTATRAIHLIESTMTPQARKTPSNGRLEGDSGLSQPRS